MNRNISSSYNKVFKLSLIIMFIFLFIQNPVKSQSNLITNGDFEYGTIGWTSWGASLSLTNDSHSGSYAVRVSNRKNSWNALVKDISNLLINGNTYSLSVWFKFPDSAVNFRATLALNVDGNMSYQSYFTIANPIIGSYQYYSTVFTPSWSGKLVSANLYFESGAVNNVYSDYIMDDVKLQGTVSDTSTFTAIQGFKDIKSTMLIGGCVTDGTQNYFTSGKAKAQALTDCNAVTIQCYPFAAWDATMKYAYHIDDFNIEARELKNHNLIVGAHMLLGWDTYFPAWYQNNDFPADTLDSIMKNWVKDIITYKGNDTLVDIWNVVNEAISWNGSGGYWPESNPDHKNSCKLQKIGYEPDSSGLTGNMKVNPQHPVYIRRSFEYARKFTNKKLELRDATIEFPTDSKYNAFYQLAVHLKKVHAPVDVISFQTHLNLENLYDWDGYSNNITRYRKLGYEVSIPEVDIGDVDKSWSDDKAELQKMMYYRLVTAAIKGGAGEMQIWGFNDNNNAFWRFGENALPYTIDFKPKPAYYGIQEALTDMSHILFWEMDSTSNSVMPDVMSYNNFGNLIHFDSPVFVNGFKSKALQFNGVDNYISTGLLSDSIKGNLTFSCFIKTATIKSGIIADIAREGISGLKIGINSNGKLFLNAAEAGLSSDLVSSVPVNNGSWHFIALRRDSDSYLLYLDSATPVSSGKGSIQTLVKLAVGAKIDGSSAFEGIIDEVKLFDTAIEEASFTRDMVPYCPLKLTVTNSRRVMRLSWLNQSSNADGFIIERKVNDSAWEQRARVVASQLSLYDTIEHSNMPYTYRVNAFNIFGKSACSNSVTVTGIFDYIPENNTSEYRIFPNPVSNSFTLVSSKKSAVKIYDIHGKLMLEKNNLSGKDIINMDQFPPGIYFVKIYEEAGINVIKLIKR